MQVAEQNNMDAYLCFVQKREAGQRAHWSANCQDFEAATPTESSCSSMSQCHNLNVRHGSTHPLPTLKHRQFCLVYFVLLEHNRLLTGQLLLGALLDCRIAGVTISSKRCSGLSSAYMIELCDMVLMLAGRITDEQWKVSWSADHWQLPSGDMMPLSSIEVEVTEIIQVCDALWFACVTL